MLLRSNVLITEKTFKMFEKTLENIKTIRWPDKRSPSTNICLEAENDLTFEPYTIFEILKNYFLILQMI